MYNSNIGSIGSIADFRAGKGAFASEQEFLEYWRAYSHSQETEKD